MNEKKNRSRREAEDAHKEQVMEGEDCAGEASANEKDSVQQNAFVEDSGKQKYMKQQLVASARYRNNRDLISAILNDGAMYTVAEVDRMVENYMKGKVT